MIERFAPGGFYYWHPDETFDARAVPLQQRVVASLCAYPAVYGLIAMRCVLALILIFGLLTGWAESLALFLLLSLVVFVNVRVRYSMEGADQLMGILLGGLSLASLAPGSGMVQNACLWFIAIQSAMSYLTAGISKSQIPAWRDGSYLMAVLRTNQYGHPLAARSVRNTAMARWLSRFIIAFESTFPLALFTGAPGALFFCGLGGMFHLMNAYFMGLNVFFWTFLSTYPAVLHAALQFQGWVFGR
jgi:hypothetical protein